MRLITLTLLLLSFGAQAAGPDAKPPSIDWNALQKSLFHAEKSIPPNVIKNDWLMLLANGCDLDKHKVYTPFAASVLRNTPYALAGYAFKTKGLQALFRADGGWYTPKTNTAPKFEPDVGACIAKIKGFESKKAFSQTAKLKAALLDDAGKDRTLYLRVRAFSNALIGHGKISFDVTMSKASKARFMQATVTGPDGSYKVICHEPGECHVSEGAPPGYEGPQ